MKVTTYTVNEAGAQEIREFLSANHKRGSALGDKELEAWVADAECQLGEGNAPTIEVGATDSVCGFTVTYTVSDAGLDAQVVEIEDEDEQGMANHPNRGRLTITLNGPWSLYQHVAPSGWDMLGTVQRGAEIGALARTQAGLLVQINAGAVRRLDQRKAAAALEAARRA